MASLQCPRCSQRIDVPASQRSVKCPACGYTYPLSASFHGWQGALGLAEDARRSRDFSAACAIYNEILAIDPACCDAYWGRALSRWAMTIAFTAEGSSIVICDHWESGKFRDDPDVTAAVKAACNDAPLVRYYAGLISEIEKAQQTNKFYSATTPPAQIVLVTATSDDAELFEAESDDAEWFEAASDDMVWFEAESLHALLCAQDINCVFPQMYMSQYEMGQAKEARLYHDLNTAGTMIYYHPETHSDDREASALAKRFLAMKQSGHPVSRKLILVCKEQSMADPEIDWLRDEADIHLTVAEDDLPAATILDFLNEEGNKESWVFSAVQSGALIEDYERVRTAANQQIAKGNFDAGLDICMKLLHMNAWDGRVYIMMLMCDLGARNDQELIESETPLADQELFIAANQLGDVNVRLHCNTLSEENQAFIKQREKEAFERKFAESKRIRLEEEKRAAEERKRAAEERKRAAEERKRLEEEELKRQERAKQLLAAMEAQRQEKKKRRRDTRFGWLFLAAVLALMLWIGGPQIQEFVQAQVGPGRAYARAMALYESGDYAAAAGIFEDLGDHEDSADLYGQCMVRLRQQQFEQAISQGGDPANRADAVESLLELLEDYPEGQEYLDRWHEEAAQYYRQGQFAAAQKLLRGFGDKDPLQLELRRMAQNAGLISISDTGAFLAVTADAGLLTQGCEHLGIQETAAWSVSISDSGASAGLIRPDGTACLYGGLAGKFDVSGWTDMRVIQITDSQVVGLQRDGTLRCAEKGVLARDVKCFDACDGDVIAVRQDGTVFCTNEKLRDLLADCANAVYAAVARPYRDQYQAYIVDGDNALYIYSYTPASGGSVCEAHQDARNIVAVITDSGEAGILYSDGDVAPVNSSDKEFPQFGSAYIADFSDLIAMRISADGSGSAPTAADADARALGNIINRQTNIGFPY